MLTNASCVFYDVDRTCGAVVHSDCYVIIIVFLHTTPAYPSLWNSACYIMITVDRGSTSTSVMFPCKHYLTFHRGLFDSTDQRRLHAWLRSVCSSSSSSCVRSWVGWSWWRVGPITRLSKAPRSSSKLKRSWCKNSRRRNTDRG